MDKLSERGIADEAAAAGWLAGDWYDAHGWFFPLQQANGQRWLLPDGRPAQRWKAQDSSHTPKYTWGYPDQRKGTARKPDGCDYYWLPGGTVANDIKESEGALYLACGEPDMLTFASAGIRNVTSLFGEGQLPPNMPQLFTRIGVTQVHYYPDNDHTGWDDAVKLYDLFRETDIVFTAYGLPYECNDRAVNDINDLWVALAFDENAFLRVLSGCKRLDFLGQTMPAPDETDESWDDYHRAVLEATGAVWKGSTPRGWSKPMACLFVNHDHDDRSPAAGYHADKGTFRCFKCGQTWSRDDVAAHFHIDKPKPKAATAPTRQPAAQVEFHTSSDSYTRWLERIDGMNPIEPIPFPLESLHHLGGFCRVVYPGKLIGVLGLSGGGKTSFIETMGDKWRMKGYHLLWWGPEWTWEEMTDRAMQRYGNITMTQMMLHELAMSEEANDVPTEQRIGERLPSDAVQAGKETIAKLRGWPGLAYYIDKMDITLDHLLSQAQNYMDNLKSNRPHVAVFDYIQLAEISGAYSDGDRIPRAVAEVKKFVVDNRLVGVVATQARKSDSEKMRESGDLLTAEAAQYFRDDKTNLFITLNPDFDSEGNLMGTGYVNVVKNSGGKREAVSALPDPARLQWLDSRKVRRNEIPF